MYEFSEGNKYSLLLASNYRYFASQYAELAEDTPPVKAISFLSQNRVEIEKIKTDKQNKLIEYARPLIKSDTSISPLQVCNSIYFKAYSSDNPFPALGGIVDDKMKFGMYIQPFLIDEESTIKEQKDKLYELTENWFRISRKLEAIESVISKVILNGYPKEIGHISSVEIEEKETESKLGRPLDDSAPQDRIREKVKELAKIKRYKNDDGTPKPTAIRDEILNNHHELYGAVSESTVFRRVKRAIETLGIS